MSKKLTKENIMEVILAAEETEGETHIRHFYEAVDAGVHPTAEIMQFFANAFKDIYKMKSYNGNDIKKTLQLSKTPGPKKDTTKPLVTAYRVEKLLLEHGGVDKARNQVAKDTSQHIDTVRKHHRKHKQQAKAILQSELSAIKSKLMIDRATDKATKSKLMIDHIIEKHLPKKTDK